MAANRPSELFTTADLMTFETLKARVVHDAKRGVLTSVKAILAALALIFVFAIEYTAFREIYDYIKAPVPGEGFTISPAVLALTGVVMVIALHLRAAMKKDSLPVLLLERAVDILLPLYVLGAGLMFAGILFFDGADGLLAPATEGFSIIGSAPEEASAPLLTRLFSHTVAPLISVAFSLGAGAVVVVTVFVGHRCLSLLAEYGFDLDERVRRAKSAIEAHKEILTAQEEYRRINGELTALEEAATRDIDRELAAELGGICSEGIVDYQRHINNRRINPEPNAFEPRRELDLGELEARVRDIESITPAEIIAALRGHPANADHRPAQRDKETLQ